MEQGLQHSSILILVESTPFIWLMMMKEKSGFPRGEIYQI